MCAQAWERLSKLEVEVHRGNPLSPPRPPAAAALTTTTTTSPHASARRPCSLPLGRSRLGGSNFQPEPEPGDRTEESRHVTGTRPGTQNVQRHLAEFSSMGALVLTYTRAHTRAH
jgi:hypothetical protein